MIVWWWSETSRCLNAAFCHVFAGHGDPVHCIDLYLDHVVSGTTSNRIAVHSPAAANVRVEFLHICVTHTRIYVHTRIHIYMFDLYSAY